MTTDVKEKTKTETRHGVAFSSSIEEARRQIQICNACRYCEGFCSVFPAINRERSFASGDITQLANLCHNCRGCYHACQYTKPHEFSINIPGALSDVRSQSWENFIKPAGFARLFQSHGVLLAVAAVIAVALLFLLARGLATGNAAESGFYAVISHSIMVAIFAPAFILPLIIITFGLRSYWHTVGGDAIKLAHIREAFSSAAKLKNLSGGQGQGCNFEKGDRFTNSRRWLHQAAVVGFLLCFASTSSATLMHYLLSMEAPYPFLSLPKLLGIPGGLLLSFACAGLAWLKVKAERHLGAPAVWGGEMAFVVLLGATGGSGLMLYAGTGTNAVTPLLAIHLGTVLVFFLTMPYTKMVHGFFRLAALVRESQLSSKND